MAGLIQRTALKRKSEKKTTNRNRVAQKKRSGQGQYNIVREASPGGRIETTGIRFVQQVCLGFKPGVKKEGVMDEQCGKLKEEEAMDDWPHTRLLQQ